MKVDVWGGEVWEGGINDLVNVLLGYEFLFFLRYYHYSF